MRVIIDNKSISLLMNKTDLSGPELISDALGLLSWAIEEVAPEFSKAIVKSTSLKLFDELE